MDCQAFEQRLEAYLSGDLAPAGRTEMEEHRIACARCQRAVERAKQLNDLLRDGLTTAAAMTPAERVALRESVLSRAHRRRPSLWRRWVPRLAAVTIAMAVVIVVGLALPGREGAPSVSAAEIVTRAQAATDEHAGLSGVLRWETSLEQWAPGSDEVLDYEKRIWFDFDDPGRYRLHYELSGEFLLEEVRDGVDHLWKYLHYPNREDASFVDEIILSPEEMQGLASWHVPSPFRDDLSRFADVLTDVEVVGETNVAGRRAYLLRGQLFGLGAVGLDGIPRPTASTVTLTVDAETYWLLGREEVVEGEARPRIVYRTERFELLPQDQVPDDAFTFTPPEGAEVRRVEGIEGFYREPRLPAMTMEEAADAAPFTLLVPSALPDDFEPPPHILQDQLLQDKVSFPVEEFVPVYRLIYRGKPGRQMVLSECILPIMPGLAARLVDIGGRQGWLESDLIDSRLFTLYLLDWDIARHYMERYVEKEAPEDLDDELPPGSVILQAWGLSVDEAIAVLESLEPYAR